MAINKAPGTSERTDVLIHNAIRQASPEGELKRAAQELAALIGEIDGRIQALTDDICPSCASVCCISRHGRYTAEDASFLIALGQEIPLSGPAPESSAPCRFLGEKGCELQRHLRPYRCTWYFCDALLCALKEKGPRYYRSFVDALARITQKRLAFLSLVEQLAGEGLPEENPHIIREPA